MKLRTVLQIAGCLNKLAKLGVQKDPVEIFPSIVCLLGTGMCFTYENLVCSTI